MISPVGQQHRADVRAGAAGDLPQPAAVDADLVDVPIALDARPVGREEDRPGVVGEARVVDRALRLVVDHPRRLVRPRRIEHAQARRLRHGMTGIVRPDGRVLVQRPADEHDRRQPADLAAPQCVDRLGGPHDRGLRLGLALPRRLQCRADLRRQAAPGGRDRPAPPACAARVCSSSSCIRNRGGSCIGTARRRSETLQQPGRRQSALGRIRPAGGCRHAGLPSAGRG